MAISGDNFQPTGRDYDTSYYFSLYNHVWGWATWRRAWEHYDGQIPEWKSLRGTGWLKGWLGTEQEARYWRGIFDRVAQEEIDTWDYPWTFACWKAHGLTVLPAVNLVSNIGFDERGTHTSSEDSNAARLSTEPLTFPLQHPSAMVRDYGADRLTSKHHFEISSSNPPRWRQLASSYVPRSVKRVLRSVF
jgi:hypothetical protein